MLFLHSRCMPQNYQTVADLVCNSQLVSLVALTIELTAQLFNIY